jgi:hypothetical protein
VVVILRLFTMAVTNSHFKNAVVSCLDNSEKCLNDSSFKSSSKSHVVSFVKEILENKCQLVLVHSLQLGNLFKWTYLKEDCDCSNIVSYLRYPIISMSFRLPFILKLLIILMSMNSHEFQSYILQVLPWLGDVYRKGNKGVLDKNIVGVRK